MKPVLFVISNYCPAVGGAETQAALLATALAQVGQPMEVLTCELPGLPREEQIDGVPVHRRIRLIRRHGWWAATHFASSLAFLLRRGGDYRAVVGFQLQAYHTPAGVLWQRLTGGRFVVRASGAGPTGDLASARAGGRGVALRAGRRASAVVALGAELRGQLLAAGFAPERVVTIPNAVDVALFSPGEADGRAGIVFVGRLIPGKGLEQLVEAVGLLHSRGVRERVTVFGDGPERGRLEAAVRAAGLADTFDLRGSRPRAEIAAALRTAAAFVLPSVEEGMSNALLEAMASGCPAVASAIDANRELVADGETGLLSPPGDAAALADALGRLLADRALAGRLAAAALGRIARAHTPAVAAGRWLELFAHLEGKAP